jgi:hypothetical protein
VGKLRDEREIKQIEKELRIEIVGEWLEMAGEGTRDI